LDICHLNGVQISINQRVTKQTVRVQSAKDIYSSRPAALKCG